MARIAMKADCCSTEWWQITTELGWRKICRWKTDSFENLDVLLCPKVHALSL